MVLTKPEIVISESNIDPIRDLSKASYDEIMEELKKAFLYWPIPTELLFNMNSWLENHGVFGWTATQDYNDPNNIILTPPRENE